MNIHLPAISMISYQVLAPGANDITNEAAEVDEDKGLGDQMLLELDQTQKMGDSMDRSFNHMGLSENRAYSQWNSHLIRIMIINQWV